MNAASNVLLTDLYQLTMMQGYFQQAMHETAVFEFFVRKMPENRGFLLAAGLEQTLDYLENLRFTQRDLDYLASTEKFTTEFLQWLQDFRFEGDVHAMAEGRVFFQNEPILRITAPIAQAQLVESRVINILHFQVLIASKATRCVLTAPDKLLVDFGMRRAHGAEAAMYAARASYLAGFAGSSTVLAGSEYGIPIYGTMAHSFIQAHDSELDAFEHFATTQPDNVVLLIDTYDTEAGAQKVVELAPRLRERGIAINAVRLDSGDLAAHALAVREILDAGGLTSTKIFCSGSLDEYRLKELLAQNAPIDGFGVGTSLDTSADAPYLDCAYKLQEYAGIARRKRSEGKATWPGRKQVYRQYDDRGTMTTDTITLENDPQPGEALIEQVMQGGRRLAPSPSLAAIRERTQHELQTLPTPLRNCESVPFEVNISNALQKLAREVDMRPH